MQSLLGAVHYVHTIRADIHVLLFPEAGGKGFTEGGGSRRWVCSWSHPDPAVNAGVEDVPG